LKYQYLNKEDEYELINAYQNGDESALEKLIHFNQLNIKMIVSKFRSPKDDDYNDAIQEANFGLIRAIQTFKTSTNNRLISLANTIIRNRIFHSTLEQTNSIRVPIESQILFRKIEDDEDVEASDYMKFYSTFNYNCYEISSTPNEDDEYQNYVHSFNSTPDTTIINYENKEEVDIMLDCLSEDEKVVIEHRFGLNDKPIMVYREIFDMYFNPENRTTTSNNKISIIYRKYIKALKKIKKLYDKDILTR